MRRRRRGRDDFMLATKTLTDAQIKLLPTTPVQIVPAPGAGKMIMVIQAAFFCNQLAGKYTNFNTLAVNTSTDGFASSVYLALDAANNFNDATGAVTAGSSDDAGGILNSLGSGEKRVAVVNGVSGTLTGILTGTTAASDTGFGLNTTFGFDNADLSVVGQNNGLGNFTGGNAANYMKVTVIYQIVDIL